jgi:hypothetical protein
MQVTFVGTPVIRSSRNVVAEKADIQVTRDDGTQAVATTRAIKMHVGDDLVVEAWISVVEGQTYLALATWRTLNVLGDGRVGREVNVAVQDEAGELTVEPDQYLAVTLQTFNSIQDVETYIAQAVQQAQQVATSSP